MAKAAIKSKGQEVKVSATRGRFLLLARLVGKKAAKEIMKKGTQP